MVKTMLTLMIFLSVMRISTNLEWKSCNPLSVFHYPHLVPLLSCGVFREELEPLLSWFNSAGPRGDDDASLAQERHEQMRHA